jgi:hypothetical protein
MLLDLQLVNNTLPVPVPVPWNRVDKPSLSTRFLGGDHSR